MNPGIYFLIGAAVASTASARMFSQADRGTPASRVLLLIGLACWIIAAFLLPPVAWLERLGWGPWVTLPLRALAACLLGNAVSKLSYSLVP
jgi:hypothetical protein